MPEILPSRELLAANETFHSLRFVIVIELKHKP